MTTQNTKFTFEFLEWLNHEKTNTINPVLVAGISHYEIVPIHPFIDGNGRPARVIATLYLLRKDY